MYCTGQQMNLCHSSIIAVYQDLFPLRFTFLCVFLYFHNIAKPTIKGCTYLCKAVHSHRFALAHFGKYICADTRRFAHLRFGHTFIYQQFPKSVIIVNRKEASCAWLQTFVKSITRQGRFFNIMSRFRNLIFYCLKPEKSSIKGHKAA